MAINEVIVASVSGSHSCGASVDVTSSYRVVQLKWHSFVAYDCHLVVSMASPILISFLLGNLEIPISFSLDAQDAHLGFDNRMTYDNAKNNGNQHTRRHFVVTLMTKGHNNKEIGRRGEKFNHKNRK